MWSTIAREIVSFCVFALFSSATTLKVMNDAFSNQTACHSPACYDFVEELEADMDTLIDPCDNFYDFVCGRYRARYKVKKLTKTKIRSAQEVLKSRVEDVLKFDYGPDPPLMREAATLFKQCSSLDMNKGSSWKLVFDHLNQAKVRHFGLWPIVTPNWDVSQFDLTDALSHLQSTYSISPIYKVDYSTDSLGNETKPPISISIMFLDHLPHLTINSRTFLAQNPFQSKLKEPILEEVVEKYSSSMNVTLDEEQMKNDILEMTKFEEKLKVIHSSWYYPENYTLAEVQNISKKTDWVKFFKNVFGNNATNKDQIVQVDKTLILKTEKLLEATPKRVIANFVHWKFLVKFLTFFGNCYDAMTEKFQLSIGAAYIDKFIDTNMLDQVKDYVYVIRSVFRKMLKSATWFDEQTRERALRRLELMGNYIVVPNMYRDRKVLREIYKPLKISETTGPKAYLENLDTIFNYGPDVNRLLKAYGDPTSILGQGALWTNAMFSYLVNAIVIFGGVLLKPFYHPELPPAVNLGAIGFVLGHEISHAFNGISRQFDEFGNRTDWWSNETAALYQKPYDCFVNNYAKFASRGTNSTEYSKKTAEENIADSGGLKAAYEALKSLLITKRSANQKLPGSISKYTQEQLFFISFGNLLCGQLSEKDEEEQRKEDGHSTEQIRVIATAMNSMGFSEAFKCPVGSKMNSARKCSLYV